jgi:hypothetical protein
MALYDSADCAQRVLTRLNRPSTDEAFTRSTTNDVLYELLTEAQDRLCKLIAVYTPDAMWTVPTALSSADAGYTYTFGTDADSASIFALGQFRIYSSREDIPDFPMQVGVDFTVEGTTLRIPNHDQRTFSDGGPWAQYVAPPNVITASTQPTIPKVARLAMIEDCAARCAKRLALDPSEYEAAFDTAWMELLAAIRTQSYGRGGLPLQQRPRGYFYRGRRY